MRPTRIPFEGRDVPHVVIEVNQKCNLSCRACYKDKLNSTKPLEEVKREIDLARSARRLSLVTLAGGEPMLHPELPEIIRYVRSCGIDAQILSNGYALTDEVLARFREAGLKEVFLHVDSQQRRPDARGARTEAELNPLRARIAEKITKNGLLCSLVVTVYRSTLASLADVVDFALESPNVTRCLFTCCTDFSRIEGSLSPSTILGCQFGATPRPAVSNGSPDGATSQPSLAAEPRGSTGGSPGPAGNETPSPLAGEEVTIGEVRALLDRRFGMHPFGYIGSSHDPSDERWLMYHSFTVREPGRKHRHLHLHPRFGRLARMKVDRAKEKGTPIAFGKVMTKKKCVELCAVYAAQAASAADAGAVLKTGAFLARLLRKGATIHYKDFTIQQPPIVRPGGTIDYCRDCPDATVRDGVLVPVCLADIVSQTGIPANS